MKKITMAGLLLLIAAPMFAQVKDVEYTQIIENVPAVGIRKTVSVGSNVHEYSTYFSFDAPRQPTPAGCPAGR